MGDSALLNTNGIYNTAVGVGALDSITTGDHNIAIGVNAAANTTTGDNNIWLGNVGLPTPSDTIFIGQSQTRTLIADVDPNLVAYSSTGDVATVQYHLVNAMLLNEVQKQHRLIETQKQQLDTQAATLAALLERLTALERRTESVTPR